jgi:flagellar hook protein FlgE
MSLIGTLGSGVSALRTFMKGLEVIGDNIANVNTTATRLRGEIRRQLQQHPDAFRAAVCRRQQHPAFGVGTGVTLAGVHQLQPGLPRDHRQNTDLGISGNGFFHVKNVMDGTEYATRAGDFRWDDQGYLVTSRATACRARPATASATVSDIKLGTPPANSQRQSITIDKRQRGRVLLRRHLRDLQPRAAADLHGPPRSVREGNNLYSGMQAAGPVGAAAGFTRSTPPSTTPPAPTASATSSPARSSSRTSISPISSPTSSPPSAASRPVPPHHCFRQRPRGHRQPEAQLIRPRGARPDNPPPSPFAACPAKADAPLPPPPPSTGGGRTRPPPLRRVAA